MLWQPCPILFSSDQAALLVAKTLKRFFHNNQTVPWPHARVTRSGTFTQVILTGCVINQINDTWDGMWRTCIRLDFQRAWPEKSSLWEKSSRIPSPPPPPYFGPHPTTSSHLQKDHFLSFVHRYLHWSTSPFPFEEALCDCRLYNVLPQSSFLCNVS